MPRVVWIVLGMALALSCGISTPVAKASSTTPNFSGEVWYDTNGNGLRDYNEQPVSNVFVLPQKLASDNTTWEDVAQLATYTDANGNYAIRLNADGTWRLRFYNPDASKYVPTKWRYTGAYSKLGSEILEGTSPYSDRSAVTEGFAFNGYSYGGMNSYPGVNAGWMPTAFSVSGFAFLENETEINHYYNEGSDYLLKNVTVTLCDASGNPISGVAATRTNDAGKFEIKGLAKNTYYTLRYDLPNGSSFSFVSPYASRYNSSINAKTDSKAVPIPGSTSAALTEPFQVTTGDMNEFSVGCYAHNYISGVVWEDKSQDGRKDDSEPVISGMEVQVLKSDLSTYIDTANQLYVVKTNTNGRYVIAGLPAGAYKLVFKRRQTTDVFTAKNKDGVPDALSSKVDADGLTDVISVYVGGSNTAPQRIANINAGVYTSGSTPVPAVSPTVSPTPTPVPGTTTPPPSFDDGEFEEMTKTGENALPLVLSIGGGMILLGIAAMLMLRKKRTN